MSADFNPQFSKLGEILVHNGKATEGGINEALVQQKTTNDKIGVTLIETVSYTHLRAHET